MFWVAMSLLFRHSDGPRHGWYGPTLGLMSLITVTVISGGFVAGLKAGLTYNTFPLMGGQWIPPGLIALDPVWRNLFDNVVTVQFDHRVLAITTFAITIVYWISSRGHEFPQRVRSGIHVLLAVACAQVVVGISTLLLHVPTLLATAHQATALILFTVALYLCHALRGAR